LATPTDQGPDSQIGGHIRVLWRAAKLLSELASSVADSQLEFCIVPNRALQRFVLLSPTIDLLIGLAALSVSAMTLGMLIPVLGTGVCRPGLVVSTTGLA
jgi:hypothetical protein